MKLSGDVVVTGGAGAIGSNLARRILKEPEVGRLFVIDNLSAGHEWLLPEDEKVTFFDDPIELVHEIAFAPKNPIVFHLAAHFANELSVREPLEDTYVNVGGTVAMLDWAAKRQARLFVFASAGCAADHEDSPYQISKTAGEAYCRYYHDRVPTAVWRFHNSYGEGEVPGPYRNVIPRMIWRAINGEPLQIFGDGDDCRDFVHVSDVVEDLVNSEPLRTPREIGTGRPTAIYDLARTILEVGGVTVPIETGLPRRRWDHRGRAATTNMRLRVQLEEGLRRTWAWFRENEAKIRESMR